MPLPHLFYSLDYDIHAFGLEKLHPFDTCKHSRAYEELKNEVSAIVKEQTTVVTEAAGDDLLRLVHSQNYLEELKSPAYLARAFFWRNLPQLSGL